MTFYVQYLTATSIALDLEDRADATPTYAVKNPSGGTLSSGSVTLDTVNTTTAGAAAAGAQAIAVTSTTGITAGRKYLLDGPEDTGGERVTVKSVAGTTVTLVRPLMRAHNTASTFKSTRVTCAIASIGTINRHYRVEVTYAVGGTSYPPRIVTMDVVRYVPVSTITSFDDVADYDAVLGKRLPAGTWFPALREEAWQSIMDRVAAKVAPGAIVNASSLSRAHRYLIRELLAETGGEAWEEYRKRMARRFEEELNAALGATAVDDNQDGVIQPNEGWRRTVIVDRG